MAKHEAELHLLPSAYGNAVRMDGWMDELLEMALQLSDHDPAAAFERLERMYYQNGLTHREYEIFLEQLHQRLRLRRAA